jgi:acetyl-CoA C-acetyltransferase
MSIRGLSHIAGVYEHPERRIVGRTVAEVIADVAYGALADAGLSIADVDGFFCSSEAPGIGSISMADYLGLDELGYIDTTEGGGASYPMHIGHAAAAIAAGKCRVALVTMAGIPSLYPPDFGTAGPESDYERDVGLTIPPSYALVAMRHMYEYGTTAEDLALIKVAASQHAQHNPRALLPNVVSVEEVLESPLIADPLHRLDCCVTTDGGAAVVVVAADVARELDRRSVKVLGHGETIKHSSRGDIDLLHTGAAVSGPRAFEEARVRPTDIDYASIYDSFTITVLTSLEDLGFCEEGQGGRFVRDGALVAPFGALPINTDGGGLCNNHPDFRGGMVRTVEAVRQLREEAAAEVQVPDCELALVQGHGNQLGTRSAASTLILGRDD